MNNQRLILKHPTGWFAAGRETAEALGLLSDGAFRVFVYLCLNANRRTGAVATDTAQLARCLRRDEASVHASLRELTGLSVCAVQRGEIRIADRFWPYQRVTVGERDSNEAEFVRQARAEFLARACVESAFTAADEEVAATLHRQGVSLDQVRRAIWLGCGRKYISMLNGQTGAPVTSFRYFARLLSEVSQTNVSDEYWEHLRQRVTKLEERWTVSASSDL